VRIAILVEGKTERAFIPHLRKFLDTRLAGRMPRLDCNSFDGRLPTRDRLRRIVKRLLTDHRQPADAVIALTDVYTGTNPPEFTTAAVAKDKMTQWVRGEPRFHAAAAQHDFEAWLLPYWEEIKRLAGSNRDDPARAPEDVNHHQPPSARISEVFRTGTKKRAYIKARDAGRILKDKDLTVAADRCPELKSFLNTVLKICGGSLIP